MTVSSTTSRVSYMGSGSVGPYSFPFQIHDYHDLVVVRRSASGTDTTLAVSDDYTITGIGDRAGGSITLEDALASGQTLIIARDVALTQETSLRTHGGAFYPEDVERALDRLVMIDQQQERRLGRALLLPDGATQDGTLPTAVPGAAIVVNGAGTGFDLQVLDGGEIALPGGGRTVPSLSAYIANNARNNVRDYGAVGDGSEDDSDAIEAAVLAAGEVYFPPGEYILSRPIDLSAVAESQALNVTGAGWNESIIHCIGDGDHFTVGSAEVQRFGGRIAGLQFAGTGAIGHVTPFTRGLFTTTANEFAGCTTAPAVTALNIDFGQGWVVEGCYFYRMGTGIRTTWGYANSIRNNRFRETNLAIELAGGVTTIDVSVNLIERCAIGMFFYAAQLVNASRNVLQGNYAGADLVTYNTNDHILWESNYHEGSPWAWWHEGDSNGEFVSGNFFFRHNQQLKCRLGNLLGRVQFYGDRWTGELNNNHVGGQGGVSRLIRVVGGFTDGGDSVADFSNVTGTQAADVEVVPFSAMY